MLLGVLKMEARFILITYRISAQGSLTSSLLRATSCPKTHFKNFKIVQKKLFEPQIHLSFLASVPKAVTSSYTASAKQLLCKNKFWKMNFGKYFFCFWDFWK